LSRREAGLVPAGPGWFILNAHEARWIRRDGRGQNLPFTGWTEEEAETHFREHWEADTEDFFVLFGDALLIVGAGSGPCVVGDRRAQSHRRGLQRGSGASSRCG
jgi:hypothetical protein